MNYAQVREKVSSGDLIALTHNGWGSLYDLQVQAVAVFDTSEYVHVGMLWRVAGRVFVIESVTPTVRLVPLSKFAEEGFYWIPLSKRISTPELEFALGLVGVGKYSKWDAIKGFFKRLAIGMNKTWQCAEAVITWRRISGVDLGDKATPSAVVLAAQLKHNAPVHFIQG